MTDTPLTTQDEYSDIIAKFGVHPVEIVNRHRAHWIVETPDEDEIDYNVEPGWLAIRARDGAGNPISVDATRRPNFMATYEDGFDRTYRYYYFAPLPPTSAENARVAQEPVAWAERRELDRVKPGAARGCLLAKTPLIGDGWNFNVPLYTQDQLDAAVRAEREQVGFPTWATDEHIANGILEAAETIVQLVIHDQTHRIAEYTGVIKSHAGTLLTRRAHIAKFLAAAIREGE